MFTDGTLDFKVISEVEALFEVVGSVMVGDVCDCTKAGVVPETEGIPEVAVKLTVVSEMAGVVSLPS